jgi:hypothetical protein
MHVYYYDAATHRLHAIALEHTDTLRAHCFSRLTRDMLIVHDDAARVPRTTKATTIGKSKIHALYDRMCALQCVECVADLARILAVCLTKESANPDPPPNHLLEEPD